MMLALETGKENNNSNDDEKENNDDDNLSNCDIIGSIIITNKQNCSCFLFNMRPNDIN